MLTIPMLDWMAKPGIAQPFLCSYPKTRFANQFEFDPFNSNCGNGIGLDGKRIGGAVPGDAFVAHNMNDAQAWIQHTLNTFSTAANGGVKYYILDNEHDLWWDTHHDVVPHNPHYTVERDQMQQYAAMIKAQDPTALVVGPEVSGWLGYLFSPADREEGQLNNFSNVNALTDRVALNGQDFLPWLLGQFHNYEIANHQRLLDVFTVHYYPQDGDPNQNTRSLWDPNYVDPSYIGDKINLIPRMKQWVADNYPGTKIGITEYNWGSISNEAQTDTMALGVNQADVLGIFGREGLDLATRFNSPPPGLPTYNAMRIFRNYDGNKSTFGDASLTAVVQNPDTIAAFGAQRTADNKVTVMVLSKYAAGTADITVNLSNFAPGNSAEVFQLSGAGTSIQHLADIAVANSAATLTAPSPSITLLVFSPQPAASPTVTLSPLLMNFGAQNIGTITAASTVAVQNTSQSTLHISNISLAGARLSQTNDCLTALAPGASCSIRLMPTGFGNVSGTLTLADDAVDSPQHLNITGFGDITLALKRPTRAMRLAVSGSRAHR
jgi:hypothetical protein